MTAPRPFRRAALPGCAAVAAVAAMVAAAPASALAGHGAASGAGQVSIVITSVTPQVAGPGSKVVVSGAVVNPGSAPVTGPLAVELWSSGARLPSPQEMNVYLSTPGTGLDTQVAGAEVSLPAALAGHKTEHWSLTLPVSRVGMRAFGVYPLAAQLVQGGFPLASARTLLPYWPGRPQARAIKPLRIGWVWPLVGTPQRTVCPGVLLSDQLASEVAPGGRLGRLLAAGLGPAGVRARLTWAIDPALLSDVNAMTRPYRVGAGPSCGGAARPSSAAARTWLAGVRQAAQRQDFFTTPYDDVDVAALAHQGLDSELADAFADGRRVAADLLGQPQRPAAAAAGARGAGQLAWPPDGVADYGVLQNLAASQIGVGTVILSSGMMPAANPAAAAPSAVTTTPNGLGSGLRVLLASDGLTQILSLPDSRIPGTDGAAGGGAGAAAAAFSRKQWFLAETAMVAAQAPGRARAIVVAPPRRWNPSQALARSLLSESAAPWLRPATLASLSSGGPAAPPSAYRPPPHFRVSPLELRRPLLRRVRKAAALIELESSLFTPPKPGYLSTAVAAAESSAWRGAGAGEHRALAMLGQVSAYVMDQLRRIKIIEGPRVTLGGKSGTLPVTISNGLRSAIAVKLRVLVPGKSGVTVGPIPSRIVVAPDTRRLIKIPVRAAAAGSSTLTLRLTTVSGRPLPGQSASLTVEATHFGTLAIVIIGIALLVFMVTAAARAIRRGGPGQDGAPGPQDEFAEAGGTPVDQEGAPDNVGSERVRDANSSKGSDDNASTTGRAGRARR